MKIMTVMDYSHLTFLFQNFNTLQFKTNKHGFQLTINPQVYSRLTISVCISEIDDDVCVCEVE